jgi:surface antigen
MKVLRFLLYFIAAAVLIYFLFFSRAYPVHVLVHSLRTGDSLDSFNGITVYSNGADYVKSHGSHYSVDSSYYYGKKWQCVEFVKRYYFDHLHHKMPDLYGHAKDFFDSSLPHGSLNRQRDLVQYYNGKDERPAVDDLLVYGGKYGHVAIVTRVSENEVEVIQQNIFMHPRQVFPLVASNGNYTITGKEPFGWLRLK